MMQTVLSQIPGLGEQFRAATLDMVKNAGNLTMKMQESFYMPIMAQLQPGSDPNAAVMEMHMDLADITDDPIDSAAFAVPSGYRAVASAELMKAIQSKVAAVPEAPALPAPVARRPLPPGEVIDRVGDGVTQPSVIFHKNPEYTEEARQAKYSGSVLLSLVVDKDGFARDIHVIRALGMGLDEKAIQALQQWRFKPGMKDGQPVNVRATIEINFKLL
jgi:TonB family protein